jgi:hypothetical protein
MPEKYPETKPKNLKAEAASFVAEQARIREQNRERAEAGLPPENDAPVMPAYEVKRLELEKAALLEAMRVPDAPKPELKIHAEITMRPKAPVVPDDAKVALATSSVDDAVREQADALKAVEESKARLEAANTALTVARQEAEIVKHAQAKAAAQAKLQPLIERVTNQRRALQAIHDQHDGALTTFAKSCASGDLQERNLLQVIYSEAAPLKLKVALAFKKAEEALRLLGSAHVSGPESLQWSVAGAEKAAATALVFDPAKLRDEIETLITRYRAVRGPKLPTGPRLGPAEQAGNEGVTTGWNPDA